jgi:hypothetical protein
VTCAGVEAQEPKGNTTMPRKRKKWLLGGIVGLFILCIVILSAIAIYPFIYMSIYGRLLASLPFPPNLLLESVRTTLESYHPCGSKSYDVDDEHMAITDFFISELPNAGWELVDHKNQNIKISRDRYLKIDELIFVNHYRHWLGVDIETDIDAEGVQLDNPWVHLTVCRNAERYYIVGNSPENE